MGETHQIIIAERNPHIREFLRREMTAIGFKVRLVESSEELLDLIYKRKSVDLVVLDPDFPCEDATEMLRKITDRIPRLPVVLHCVRGSNDILYPSGQVIRIEKDGNSVDMLREAIDTILPHTRHFFRQ